MHEYRLTFGRGPGVDFVVTSDRTVSRMHGFIEYSSQSESFELHVLGKNGVFLNGTFVDRGARPQPLSSQTEITIGSEEPVIVMFYLPCGTQSNTMPQPLPTIPTPLIDEVGHVLVSSETGKLNAQGICDAVLALRKPGHSNLEKLAPNKRETEEQENILASSIRHVIVSNPHIFTVHPAVELERNVHEADLFSPSRKASMEVPEKSKGPPRKVGAAEFSVKDYHKARFEELVGS